MKQTEIDSFTKEFRTSSNSDSKLLVEEISKTVINDHKTNQGSIVRNIQSLCKQLEIDMKERGTDPRNEGALKWLEEINKVEVYIPFI